MTYSLFRRVALLLGFGLLAACTEMPQAEPCQRPEACQVASLMAAGMSSEIGTDYGGGIVLRNVQAAGSLVVVDLEVPIPGNQLEEVQKRAVHELAVEGFVIGLCGDPDSEEIFMYGNAYQMRTLGNDGALMGASTVRSCGG